MYRSGAVRPRSLLGSPKKRALFNVEYFEN